MKTRNSRNAILILSLLVGAALLSSCGRLRERRISRQTSEAQPAAGEAGAALPDKPTVDPADTLETADPAKDETAEQPLTLEPQAVQELNQLLTDLEKELLFEQIDLAEASADLELLELEALIEELEAQEQHDDQLDDLP